MKIYTQAICPKCKVLKKMLSDRHVPFVECTDLTSVSEHGFTSTPVLETERGDMMDFAKAVSYVKSTYTLN